MEQVLNDYINQYFVPFVFESIDIPGQRIMNRRAFQSYRFRNLLGGYSVLLQQNQSYYRDVQAQGDALLQKLPGKVILPFLKSRRQ